MNETLFNIKNSTQDAILRKDETFNISFSSEKLNLSNKHRLFFTCEDRKFYRIKREGLNDSLYMFIDDSLDTLHARFNTYCLDMSCDTPKNYIKRASNKIFWNETGITNEKTNTWSFGIYAKANNLKISSDGYLRVRIEKWLVKDNIELGLTKNAPDEIYDINITEGDYDYTKFEQTIKIDDSTTSCILYTLEGMNYEGNVYFEMPFFTPSGKDFNMIPDFDITTIKNDSLIWCGQNLSKREWPKFEISINNETFFLDEVFLSMHRYAPVEIDIPKGLIKNGENNLSITYKSDYNSTIPVAIREMAIIEKEDDYFSVVYSPDFVVWGKETHILIETNKDDITIDFESSDFQCTSSLEFKEKGLYVISLKSINEKNGMSFSLSYKDCKKEIKTQRIVYITEDDCICGSGDMIYINNSDEKEVKEYLSWYIRNEIGKLLTIRPVYHWGGGRTLNPKVWELVTRICNDMKISYVLMSDGRDLPGISKNPSVDELQGEGFLGRQVHERDGQLIYWDYQPRDTHPNSDTFFDLAMKEFRDDPKHSEGNYNPNNIMLKNGYYSLLRKDVPCDDLVCAYNIVSDEIKSFSNDFPRHTGPSVTFKYFYENGFDWLGAETMDGSMEPQLAFLRGASKAYNKKRTGIHHALQWATWPHDNDKKYKRFMLANYISYMHGMTDINTEEGFWFMEQNLSFHHRFSKACTDYREIQKNFNNYIQTHSRTGEFYTKTAFLYGRYDGWDGFAAHSLWGAKNLPFGEAEKSWELLKIFYPLNHIEQSGMYKVGYIPEDTDKPFGTFSGTPYGNIDVIPVENGDLSQYSLLCFAGYNAACEKDFDRLISYVENGGILVLSWLHLSPTTIKKDIDNKKHAIINHKLTQILSDGVPVFEEDMVYNKKIKICKNVPKNIETIATTDNNNPLIYSINYKKGKVILLNAFSYPGDEAVLQKYSDTIKSIHKDILNSESTQLICGDDVEYTIYSQKNGEKHFYITPVDWYNDKDNKKTIHFRIGDDIYPVSLKFGEITKIVTDGKKALWLDEMSSEILSFNKNEVVVQGYKNSNIYVAKNGTLKFYPIVFGKNPKATINIK